VETARSVLFLDMAACNTFEGEEADVRLATLKATRFQWKIWKGAVAECNDSPVSSTFRKMIAGSAPIVQFRHVNTTVKGIIGATKIPPTPSEPMPPSLHINHNVVWSHEKRKEYAKIL
jgi:hypothetical protein